MQRVLKQLKQLKKELENAVKPFGIEKGWNVSYSIDYYKI